MSSPTSRFTRASSAAKAIGTPGRSLKRAGFRKELIEANVSRLEKLVSKACTGGRPGPPGPTTASGRTTRPKSSSARTGSSSEACASRPAKLVWDLGCNDGRYSRIAAEHGGYVVSVDGDHATVDALYRDLQAAGDERILPLVMDLADPSPARGWRGRERTRLEDRGKPDLVLCLALIHHLSIAANVPLAEVVDWLASLGGALVVEFADRGDPMVERLLTRKRDDAHPDYGSEQFERELAERFEIVRREELASGVRTLYEARPR